MAIKPKGEFSRSEKAKPGYEYLFEPGFEIAAWCPDEKAQLPPEQVHFIIHWPIGLDEFPPMAIRFKSPDTLGFFIEELIKYRNHVWPGCESVNLKSGE